MNLREIKSPLLRKTKGFVHNNLFIILSFALPALIMAVVFAIRSYYPFGNRMVMISDGWHQYYPFLAEYQQMLKEGTFPAYSWNTGGGVNFFGVVANYAASPLYLLTALLPSGTPWLPLYLLFTVIVRVGLAGMFFAILLRKIFNRHDFSVVAFGTMYALCAYVMGYYWNTMWLDTFALLPLVVAGVVEVLRDKKFMLYIIALALSMMCSFYIGYMVCLCVLIFCIGYTVVSFVSVKESFKNVGRMALFTLIGFMISAVVVVPALMALGASDSASSAAGIVSGYEVNAGFGLEGENQFYNTIIATAKTITNMISTTNPIKMDTGAPNIACGMLALALVPFYFVTRKISVKEKIVSLSVLVFFVASFVINQLNYIWHGFAYPAMVYYRWSFIFSFAVLLIAYRAFTLIDSFGKKTVIVSGALLLAYFAGAFFLQKKISVAITAVGVALIFVGLILYRKGAIKYRLLSILMCVLVACDMGANCYVGARFVGSTKMENYPKNAAQVESLMETAYAKSKDELFRTEFVKWQTLNDGALNSIYGLTTFNSMVDSSYAKTFKYMGLAASVENNRYAYYESSPVTNLFLNIKYLIARDDEKPLDTERLVPVKTVGDSTLYENTAYIPTGFMTQTELLDFKIQEDWRFGAEVLNEMFTKATGIKENVFVEVLPTGDIIGEYDEYLDKHSTLPYAYYCRLDGVKASDGAETTPMTMEYVIEEDGTYYGVLRTSTDKKTTVSVNGWDMVQVVGVTSDGEVRTKDMKFTETRYTNGEKVYSYTLPAGLDYIYFTDSDKNRTVKISKDQIKEDALFILSDVNVDDYYSLRTDVYEKGKDEATSEGKVTIYFADNSFELDQSFSCMNTVGTLNKGDVVKVEVDAEFGETSTINMRMARIDEDVFARGIEKLKASSLKVSEWTNNTVKGTINAREDGLFYTSVLYCDGWKAYVDGKEVEITPVCDTFIAFELSKGDHEIELKYTTPGLLIGGIVSFVGVGLLVALCILSKRFVKDDETSEDITDTPDETEKENPREETDESTSDTDLQEDDSEDKSEV